MGSFASRSAPVRPVRLCRLIAPQNELGAPMSTSGITDGIAVTETLTYHLFDASMRPSGITDGIRTEELNRRLQRRLLQ